MSRQLSRFLGRFLGSRVEERAAAVTAGIRVFAGLAFVFFGAVKFVMTQFEVTEFVKFGFPASAAIVYLVGLLEIGAGLMLLLGLGTRHASAGLAVVMAGAIMTAGLTVGGPFHLGVAPVLLVANLYLLWAGSGSRALDRRLAARVDTTRGSRQKRLAQGCVLRASEHQREDGRSDRHR